MKKQRKNGFTLIELLAVIIILGIVALIATPIVLNVVENAQKKAFQQSAQGYYDAARYVHNDMMLNNEEKNIMFTFEDGIQRSDNPSYILETQGEIPKKGLVYLTEDGEILVSIANDKWCATTNGDGTIELTDDPNACGYSSLECFTFSDFTLTDTMKEYMNKQDLGFEEMDGTLLQVDSFDSENSSCKGVVIIPEEYEGRKVEGIKSDTFQNNLNITSVVLPKDMKIINSNAFMEASNLKQVVMNEELRYIGSYAFYGTNMHEITIPTNVAYFGLKTFVGAGLKKVTLLTKGTKYIRDQRFAPFTPTIVNGRKNSIEEVVIGPNVTTIDQYIFYDQNLKTVTIPNNVTKISSGAFGKNQLTNVDIPSTVTEISSTAFRNNQISTLDIPDSVISLGNWAFADNKISTLTIGTATNGINSSTFDNNLLTNLIIREGAVEIPTAAFSSHAIVNLSLPSTLTTIRYNAFLNNQLTSISIPASVTTIEDGAFAGNNCLNASSITILGDNPTRFDSIWTDIGFPAK